jgi:hypothetical protein
MRWQLLLAVVLVAGGLAPLVWVRFIRRRAESWSQAEGHVESATWNYEQGEGGSWPTSEVGYSYEVEGERYANIWKRSFVTADQATDFVLHMRDRKVLVRYRPGKPEKSIVWQVIGL